MFDKNDQEVPHGTLGRVVIRVKPYRPVGLFTHYVVRKHMQYGGQYGLLVVICHNSSSLVLLKEVSILFGKHRKWLT